ncbi:MAG: TauD/TfdA family dioxygenase [Alphaproteobacteria bacterium]|nr:TauD/TfdA family dioxygenase [Alphaproteobacteria bacterium]
MAIRVEPLHPQFFARVEGVDLRQPIDDAALATIQAASDRYAVLLFPGQAIDDAQQIAFSGRFGPLEGAAKANLKGNAPRLAHREIADVSNLDENNTLLKADDRRRLYSLGNQLWHTDASFRAVPARYSLLSARVIPPTGGETEFADLRAAYDALPEPMKRRIDGLVAEHSIWHSRHLVTGFWADADEQATLPPVPQVLVRTHPGSKRRSLYLASHAFKIRGMDDDAARALLDELTAFATRPEFVHEHRWSVGDLVMWDNRCTMHRGRPYDDVTHRREMHRTTVRDHASTLEQEAAA